MPKGGLRFSQGIMLIKNAGAEGATAPETLRPKGPREG